MNETGLIHLYCGDGKGKTTAAMGLCLRALGAGFTVYLMQFLKDGTSSELAALCAFSGLHLLPCPAVEKFTFQMNEEEKKTCKRNQTNALHSAVEQAVHADVLILDEVLGAISTGMLEEQALLDFLKGKPPHLEVVLTGRNPSEKLLELADYVTEMKPHKHPYERGIAARKGIEK